VKKDIVLDEAAQYLFESLGGIDTSPQAVTGSYSDGDLSSALGEEETRMDESRILLIEFAFRLAGHLSGLRLTGITAQRKSEIDELFGYISRLVNMPDRGRKILLRFRGMLFSAEGKNGQESDYVLSLGPVAVDIPIVKAVANRRGLTASHLPGRLTRAFELFSSMEISTLHISLKEWTEEEKKRMHLCLHALGRYFVDSARSATALTRQGPKTGSPATLVFNQHQKADPSLTMLAVVNKLKIETAQGLVDKISNMLRQADPSSPLNQHASIYEAVFAFKNLREKLIRPPIEINNVRWLIASKDEEVVTREKAAVGRLVMDKFNDSPQKAAQLIESIYGTDFPDLEAGALDARLERVTDFLDEIEEDSQNELVEKEVLDRMHDRLEQVPEEVFDNLNVGEPGDVEGGKEGPGGQGLHQKLSGMVSFFKHRFGTKKKMQQMMNQPVDFDAQDYETIAQDFDITPDDAGTLVQLLKSCFNEKGHFLRSTFETNIPAFAKYEKKVFEFLWYYLKEIPVKNDRVAFLNSIQSLISQMKQRKKAIRIVLDDFIHSPEEVSFTDRNALILANLLVRKYNKELRMDVEITPEEVLLVKDGLDTDVARDIAAFIDEKREPIFNKIRTIHRKTKELIDRGDKDASMPIRYLLSLERECYIFLSLVGRTTARRIVYGAVKEYGNPGSEIYHLAKSPQNMKALIQLLRVSVRGLWRFSETEDIILLKELLAAEGDFYILTKREAEKYAIAGVMKWIGEAIG